VTVSQIRHKLIDFLAAEDRNSALSAFEDWITKASWNMHLDSGINAQKFTGEIQLYLAEMDNEGHDVDWLVEKLRLALSSFPLERSESVVLTSSSTTNLMHQEWPFSPAGSSRGAAFGSPVLR